MSDKIFTRDAWRPQTFDEESSSVRVIAVTENPVRIWDWERKDFVDEILLADGYSLPPSGKVPLLDAHDRSSVASVLGSARSFELKGNTLECEVSFSGTEVGQTAAQNVMEGHLTDFSVGYTPLKSMYLKAGETQNVNGKNFSGPVKITSKWHLKELSLAPIGADQFATARTQADTPPPPLPSAAPAFPQESARAEPRQYSLSVSRMVSNKSIVDLVFYAFIAMMLVSLIQGLF
jgi:hypothetical protein